MATHSRIVVDTGVAVSALLLSRSTPRQAFDAASSAGRLLVSLATVIELDDVLHRPKFDGYLSEEQRLEFLAALIRNAELVDVTERISECRDPSDDKFLELAVSGRATCIVGGDPDLLVMHPFRGISIFTPREFLSNMSARA